MQVATVRPRARDRDGGHHDAPTHTSAQLVGLGLQRVRLLEKRLGLALGRLDGRGRLLLGVGHGRVGLLRRGGE